MQARPAYSHRAATAPARGQTALSRGWSRAARWRCRAAAASVALATLATGVPEQTTAQTTAQTNAQSDLTVPPCSDVVASADVLLDQAIAEGYTVVAPDAALSGDLVDRLQWLLAETYLVGDTGGQSLAAILAIAHKKAARLTDITPTANAAIRVVYSDRAIAILRWWKSAGNDVSVHCSGALFLDEDTPPRATTGRYGDYTTRPEPSGRAGVDLRSEKFVLNRAALRSEQPQATPPHYIMGVQMRYNLEVFQ